MVVVDIGANIGYYTLLAASQVGPDGRVLAFEPSGANRSMIQMSLNANGLRNVRLWPYAVADEERVVGFDMRDSNGWISWDDPLNACYQVRAVTLDRFLESEPRVDVVKMDIEGAEDRALRGMHRLIRNHRPVIFTEFNPRCLEQVSGVAPETFLSQLRGFDYEVLVVRTDSQGLISECSDGMIMERLARSGSTHLDLVACPTEKQLSHSTT
jgi:FkbM family methyltransferase